MTTAALRRRSLRIAELRTGLRAGGAAPYGPAAAEATSAAGPVPKRVRSRTPAAAAARLTSEVSVEIVSFAENAEPLADSRRGDATGKKRRRGARSRNAGEVEALPEADVPLGRRKKLEEPTLGDAKAAKITAARREPKPRKPLKRTDDGELVLPEVGDVTTIWSRARSTGKFVGAHVSAANGIFRAIVNAVSIRGSAFALFLRPQQQWAAPPLLDETVEMFKKLCGTTGFDPGAHILPHGSYLVNLANPDDEKREKAFEAFHDDFVRCEKLGIVLYNFHPGSAVDGDIPAAIGRIAAAVNRVHSLTSRTVAVLENSAGQGNSVGSTFEHLAAVIDLVEDKDRVGVCLDTAHLWGAGYDISTREGYESVMSNFDKLVGFRYLRGMHLNDSKADLDSRKDRHENLGKGKIGLDAFRFIMNDKRMDGMPLVLETNCEPEGDWKTWRDEIDLLYSFVENS